MERSFGDGDRSAEDAAIEPSADFDLVWIGGRTGEAERRQVVVLSVGFARVEGPDPEDVVEALARRRTRVERIVSRYGGSVERAEPEQLLVCWGWPVADEADPRLAVAAAIEISSEASDGARCGVDAGIAVAPRREARRSGAGLIGDVLKTASGQMELAALGQVAVSRTVSELVEGYFEIDQMEGRQKTWLARRSASVSHRRQHEGELVGRTLEIARLEDCWRDVSNGATRCVVITGEPGIGKSALAGWLAGRALQTGGGAVVVAGLPEIRQSLVIVEQLSLRLARLVQMSPGEWTAMKAEMPAALLFAALVVRAARSRPLALIVEDLAWIDRESLSAIEAVRREAVARECGRLMVVLTCSVDAEAAAVRHDARLDLGPLSADDIDAMLAKTDAGARLNERNRDVVREHAEGNPLYAIELARLTVERPDRDAHHRLLAGPNRINAALTGRLDALSSLKPLAQAAAVLGRLFDARILAAVLEIDERMLRERLGMLVAAGILSERRDSDAQRFRFKHALLWSQAYGSVLKARRRELHLKMAHELVARYATDDTVKPQLVAHHWKKAGQHGIAFGWWGLAARQAAGRGADAEAIDFVNEALAAKQEAPDVCSRLEEAELMSLLARQQQALRGRASPEAVSAYESALSLLTTAGEGAANDLDLDIAWGLASIHLVRGDVKAALSSSSKLLDNARERGRDDIQVLALRIHGTANLLSGRVAEAIDLLSGAAQMAEATNLRPQARVFVSDPGASALAHLASALALAGRGDEARHIRQMALAKAAQARDSHTSCNVLGVLALGAIHLGELGPAAALARASQEIARVHGYDYWAARAAALHCWVGARRSPARGSDAMQAALEAYRATGSGRASVIVHCLAAEIAIAAGQARQALAMLTPYRNKGHLQGEWIYMPELMRLEALAMLAVEPSAREGCIALLQKAEAMATEHGSQVFQARIRAALSDLVSGRTRSHKRRRAEVPHFNKKFDLK